MTQQISPPPAFNQILEGRMAFEASQLVALLPVLRLQAPRGDGPVMVLPGFMADDASTWLLRRFLESLGYAVYPWRLGTNRGRMLDFLPRVIAAVESVAASRGEPVRLVGWSRGGVLSREVARDRPDLVRAVVTLGTPVKGGANASSIGRWVQRETGLSPADVLTLQREREQRAIEVPITAVYSKTDGVVAWQACVDDTNPLVRHEVVDASHVGMGANAQVFRVVAKALAEPA